MSVIICPDADDLAGRAADLFVTAARESLQARGRFTVALAGGSTPEKTYRLLAEPDRSARVDWGRTFIFFGDERFVPPDDPRSNYRMARASLLDAVPVPPDHVYPVPTDRANVKDAAASYAGALVTAFGTAGRREPPRFDLILLGLGDDGHTASLFPGAAALRVTDAWTAATPPGVLPPPVDRVTLTYPVLNAARRVVFLVSGEKKAPAVADVLERGASPEQRPAAGVHPGDGTLNWLLDEAAASLLKDRSRG